MSDSEKNGSIQPATKNVDVSVGQLEDIPDYEHKDIGWELYQEALAIEPSEREVLAKHVKRKLDMFLLPMMCFIYFLSYLDKQTLNYANAYGLQDDLGLVGDDYSWVASITNIGYLVLAYPSNIALQKFPIGKVVACCLLVWGTILMCTTAVHNFAGLMTTRFLLGGAEACIGPAWMLLTSMFWTREEQPFRIDRSIFDTLYCIVPILTLVRAWWLGCNGLSSMVGSGLSWGFGHSNGNLAPWQLIFLVIGIISFVCGICALFVLPSSQRDCVFLSPKEKAVAVWRVSGNKTGVKNEEIQWYQIREAVKDVRLYLTATLAICIGILNGSVSNFLSALMSGFGYDSLKVLLYQLPVGAIQFSFTIAAGLLNSCVPGIMCLSIIIGFVPGLAGMVGIATIFLEHRLGLAACAWIQGTFGLSIIMTWTLVGSNVAGHTKRTTFNGVLFVFYAAGNIIGPFLFIPKEKPRYLSAIKVLAGLFGGGMLMVALFYVVMYMENKKRAKAPRSEEGGQEAGFADATDGENKAFMYKL